MPYVFNSLKMTPADAFRPCLVYGLTLGRYTLSAGFADAALRYPTPTQRAISKRTHNRKGRRRRARELAKVVGETLDQRSSR